MDFRILGSFEVWDGERELELGGPKRRAVLAYLLLHANEVVAVDRLVDQLWGEKAPRNAAAALHTHMSRLRKQLGSEAVATRAWGYVLRTDPGAIDVERFEQLVAAAESLPARERAEKLREALALWRGRPLEDLASEPAFAGEIARLEELRATVLENRIDAELEAGRHNGVVGELETLIAEHPLRERLRGQLILALYRAGRQAEALEVYRETRRMLAEQLGLEPSPELRELERAILQHDPSLRALAAPRTVLAEQGVRPGRRRRLYLAGTALALATAGGTAALALESGGSQHSAQQQTQQLTTVQSRAVPHRHTVRHKQLVLKNRPAQAAVAVHTTKPHPSTETVHAVTTTTIAVVIRPTRTSHPAQLTTTESAAPRTVTIKDDFSDPTLDPLIWSSWTSGTGASFALTNGQLVFSIASGATFEPEYHSSMSNLGTKCKFAGDFDARVDFDLSHWPTGNGASVSLTAYQTGPIDEISRSTTTQWDIYNSFPGRGAVALADPSGVLRMARTNGIVRTYLWHHEQWKELSKLPIDGEVWVGVSIGTFAAQWQQQPVTAAFDNFILTASDADCPAGSDPRNP